MNDGFFDVVPDDLSRLGSDLAVSVLREMLWAETHNIGMPITATDIPFAITNADGGVDASVKETPAREGNGLIFAPKTAYQVKAGDFKLNATSFTEIEQLIVKPTAIARRKRDHPRSISGKHHKPEDMSPRIRACLDDGGVFVIMLFGNDNPDIEENATENAIKDFLREIDPTYANAKIKVWRQSKICGLLRQFPAVSLQVKGNSHFPLFNFEQWASRLDMAQPYQPGEAQLKKIEDLRAVMRGEAEEFIHVRIIDEPGIGKTRLILEMLRADDLRSLTLYASTASKIDFAIYAAIRAAKDANIILVVDECSPQQRGILMQELAGQHSKLKIVSIYPDIEEGDRDSRFRLSGVPPLPEAEIEAILLSNGVDKAVVKEWAKLCEGSPRVAHIISRNLVEHPDDPLRQDGVTRIWERYLADDTPVATDAYRHRHIVASSMALFKKFGWSSKVIDTAKEVYEHIIAKLEPKISFADFSSIVTALASRKVFQGDHYLYITPKALHLRLWNDWWHQYGKIIDMNHVVPSLSEEMRQWFAEMIEYASSQPTASKLVKELLGPSGPYKDAQWIKKKAGARFFFSLAIADPDLAIETLERTLGAMNRQELQSFDDGRRDVIWALEQIALHDHLFSAAARLLLRLADAENETWSNNATGVFTELFNLGYGDVAPTSLSPEQRLKILLEAINAGGNLRTLALDAFDHALGLHNARIIKEEPFRLRKPVKRWTPETYGEIYSAYRLYWNTLRSLLVRFDGSDAIKVSNILLSRMPELFQIRELHGDLLETLHDLMKLEAIDRREIIQTITNLLTYDHLSLPDNVVEQLENARDSLIGVGYASRLRRYAGMDMLEDRLDREGNEIDAAAGEIKRLVAETLDDKKLFEENLEYLVSGEPRNGYRFGYALSQSDSENELWPLIEKVWLGAGEGAQDFFIGGYLRGVFEKQPGLWQDLIFRLAESTPNVELLSGVVWRSGITDNVAKFLISTVREGRLRPESLQKFSSGRATEAIPEDTFHDWLTALVKIGDYLSLVTALNLAGMSVYGGRKLPPEIIERVIINDALFDEKARGNNVLVRHWVQLAKVLASANPKAELLVLRTMLANVGKSFSVMSALGPEGERYLDELVLRNPEAAWDQLSGYLNVPLDTRGFVITQWLRGDSGFGGRRPGPMRHIPRDLIWSWVGEDKDKRASLVASMAPKDFDPQTWKGGLVREVLSRFGDSDRVQSAVYSNFFSGGFVGPASSHYADQLETLNKLLEEENDPNVIRWIKRTIKSTTAQIENAKIDEERRGY